MPRLALINENAGAVAALGVKACTQSLFEHCGADEIDIEIAAGDPARLIDRARAAPARGVDDVIVLGGDGTLAAVAGALAGTGVAMAPLPGGTLNAFSRDLGFDADLRTAISQLPAAQPRAVDIAYAGNHAFLNNVVFGTYASIAESREILRNAQSIGETLDAVTEVFGALAHADCEAYRIRADSFSGDVETNTVMVANNLYTGAELPRPLRARLDGGVLGLYVATSKTPADFLNVLAEAVTTGLSDTEQMRIHECARCQIGCDASYLSVTIDGEAMELRSPLDLSLKPGGLRVLAPQP